MTIRNSARRNLSLIGKPGSGKGSYGKHLSEALNLPIYVTSDLLRQSKADLNLDAASATGQLIDDDVVCETVLEAIRCQPNSSARRHGGYILDGFPRTLRQATIMETTWPAQFQIQAAVKLAVPDVVCEQKLLGRRLCIKCGGNYNVADVHWNGWELPARLPSRTGSSSCTAAPQSSSSPCDPNVDWICRDDDQPEVVKHRLRVYHRHMDPILDYFDGQDRLLKLTPYRGFADLPLLIETVQNWLQEHEEEEEKGGASV